MSPRKERFMVVPYDPSGTFLTARILRRGLTLEEARAMQAEATREGWFLLIYADSGRSPRSMRKGDA